MQKKGVNVSLTSYDDIFSTEQDRTAPVTEEIRSVPLSQLHPFKDHPFKVLDDDAMSETVESVKQIGVVVPLIARPTEDGYEIVSGHRRHHAAELAGLETVPVRASDLPAYYDVPEPAAGIRGARPDSSRQSDFGG